MHGSTTVSARFIAPIADTNVSRPDWIGLSYAALQAPLLAIIGSEPDTWGPLPEPILQDRLAHVRHLERVTVAGAGHFVHMEKPVETADIIQDFLDA